MDQENNIKMRQGWHYKINEILGDKEYIVVFDPTSEFESINGQLLTKGIELEGSINPLVIKRIDKFVTKYWPNNRRKLNNLSMRRKSINKMNDKGTFIGGDKASHKPVFFHIIKTNEQYYGPGVLGKGHNFCQIPEKEKEIEKRRSLKINQYEERREEPLPKL